METRAISFYLQIAVAVVILRRGLELGGRDVAEVSVQALRVVPVHFTPKASRSDTQ